MAKFLLLALLSGADVVGLLFVGLKLVDLITWSWWWVLSPFWVPNLVILFGGIIYTIFAKEDKR